MRHRFLDFNLLRSRVKDNRDTRTPNSIIFYSRPHQISDYSVVPIDLLYNTKIKRSIFFKLTILKSSITLKQSHI